MKRYRRIIMAALLAGAVPVPTMAAVPASPRLESLGTVDIGGRPDRDVVYNRFGGPIESLQLRATDSDVFCRSITARFGNGRTREIFSGRLAEGRARNIDLPGDARHVSSLTFNCRSDERWGGKVRILADIGRYRSEWQRSPDWTRFYSQLFNWGNGGDGPRHSVMGRRNDGWIVIGSESFEGRRDREVVSAGWRGQNIRAVALMPINADAHCGRVRAKFEHGPDQNLDVEDTLRMGRYNRIDLPGDRRDLVNLIMTCRAKGSGRVTVRIFGQK